MCRVCGGPLPPRARALCGAPCRAEAKRASVRAAIQKYEAESGESWRARYRDTYRAQDRRRRERDGPARRTYPALFRRHDDLRAARERGASDGEAIDRREVFERDGWVCQLCGDPVDPAVQYPAPLSASLDHRRPLACGGAHTYENVQLAHLTCNASKGARATA